MRRGDQCDEKEGDERLGFQQESHRVVVEEAQACGKEAYKACARWGSSRDPSGGDRSEN